MTGGLHEIVTLNGTQHKALVDRTKRQIIFGGDVSIALTDTIVVSGMAGRIDAVERDERCTVVSLGAAFSSEQEVYELDDICADCGWHCSAMDECGICGAVMCSACFEMGCGVCKGPHS